MNKKLIIFICLITIILSAACVSASEDVDQTITKDTSNLDTNGGILSISPSENEILGAGGNGTFTELQNMINRAGNNPVNLDKDYQWDSDFTGYGIEINNPITINGNGHTIDALGHIRIFELKAVTGVTLNNITFKNGNTDGCGGAINVWNVLSNSKFTNLNFINNTAADNGGAIRFASSSTGILFENVLFENNTDAKNGGAIYMESSSSLNTFKNVEFINNVANNNGGALYFYGESILDAFNNVRFEYNRAETEDGGAINFYKRVNNTKFNEVTFYKNTDVSSSGGAINFDKDLVNTVFNHTSFIENSAVIGGALGINGLIASNTFENILFIDNTALNNGGAINIGTWDFSTFNENKFKRIMFINNTATNKGGALFVNAQSSSNTFENMIVLNNTGSSAIYMNYPDSSNVIKDSIFMNNNANTITTESGNIQLTDNWFGNNATNYNENPNVNTNLDNWLFLNATANPAIITMNKTSTVTFKFYSYKGSDPTSEYTGTLKVPLDLSSTLGLVDKTNASIGEKITYTPSEMGKGSVTGQFENAYYTINIDNDKIPTTIKLTEDSYIVYIDDTKNNLAVLQDNEGKNITGEYTLTYTSNDVSVVKIVDDSFVAVGQGIATITVSFNGTDKYEAANDAIFSIGVLKIPTTITITNNTVDLKVFGSISTGAALNPPEAGKLVYNSNNTHVAVVTDGIINATGKGQATITVSFAGNNKYTSAEDKTITVNVSLNDAKVTVENDTLDLYVDDTYSINATKNPDTALLDITYKSSNDSVATVDKNGIVTAVGEGSAIITIDVGDDVIFVKNSTTVTVTVKKIPTEIIIQKDTLDLKVYNLTYVGANLLPAEAGDLTFNSSNNDVAYVSKGMIVPAGKGQAVITVSFAGNNKYAAAEDKIITVNVSLNDASVSVDKDTLDLYVDDTYTINATTVPAFLKDYNITYKSSDDTVATVDSKGTVTAVGEGTAIITLTLGDDKIYAKNSTNVTVTVSKIPTEITANTTENLFVDDEANITYNLIPEDAEGDVRFMSNDTSIVYADAETGIIVARSEGTATITVSFFGNDKYAPSNTTLTVTVSKIPTEITVENTTIDMKVSDIIPTGVTLTPKEAGHLGYTSSNSSVATILFNGIVALSKGTTIITLYFEGNHKYAAAENKTITINVELNDASVSVDNDTLDLKVDETYAINATTEPEILKYLCINYTSSDESVATVDENGTVTAVGEGTAIITLTVGDDKIYAKNSTNVTVTVSKIPTEITANTTENLFVDDEANITYNLIPEDAEGDVRFMSNDTSIVYADAETGIIVARSEGTATITVSFFGNDKYAQSNTTLTVTVSKIPTKITVENDTIDLKVLNNILTGATLTPEEAGRLRYTSSNSSVATVYSGYIFAVSKGTATITVYFEGNDKYAAAENKIITVNVELNDASVSVDNDTLNLKVDDTQTINATTNPKFLKDFVLTYTSSDESVATVDENGTVTAIGEGTAIITLTVGDGEIYAINSTNVTVTVVKVPTEITANTTENLFVDDEANITYNLIPEDAEGDVRFMSNDTSIVYADAETGIIVARGEGTATITVSFFGNDKYAPSNTTITVTVSKIPTEITVENDTFDLKVLDSIIPGATLTPEEAGLLSYTSSNSSIATILFDRIVAINKGTATITVYFEGNNKYAAAENKTITINVELNDASVSVDNDTLDLKVDETYAINATTEPDFLKDFVLNYTSSDESVATVDENGTVTAIGEGTAIITLTVGDGSTYAINSTNVTVTVVKVPTEITANTTENLYIDDEANITYNLTPEDAEGDVRFMSNDTSIVYADPETGIIVARGEGTATITVSFFGNDKYAPSNTTVTVTVSKVHYEANITQNDTNVNVAVPENATGNITLLIGNETIVSPINDGIATFDLSDVDAGNYTATVIYDGDDKYEGFTIEYPITIEQQYIITAEDVIKYYGGSERFEIILTDNKGNPVSGATVLISINGQTYERTINDDGKASIGINLNAGEYPVVVSYNTVSVDANVTVLSTVNGTDLVKVFRNATQYYATFRDSEGNYLKVGTIVRFNINGVMYDRQVSTYGLARLNINLEPGTYIITAMNPVTGERSSNNISVLSRITENKDITKYYRNATQYTATIIGDDGNPVGAGETVTFNINGVFYQRQTDEYGIVKLNINLQPGSYIITTEYKGCMVSNNINVLPVLYADDLTKMYGTPDPFFATLIDGQGKPYADQRIEFNINGVFYYRTTDSSGQAELNINLMPGEYIITSSYNGSSIGNIVTIIP